MEVPCQNTYIALATSISLLEAGYNQSLEKQSTLRLWIASRWQSKTCTYAFGQEWLIQRIISIGAKYFVSIAYQENMSFSKSRNEYQQQEGMNTSNDRMISVHFRGKPVTITVIQVYVPTSNAEEAEAEQFCESLQDLLELTPQKDVLFIIGDWKLTT